MPKPEVYENAMQITEQEYADELLRRLVDLRLAECDHDDPVRALKDVLADLGWYTGYCDQATRRRVEALFGCEHPVFGKIAELGQPTAEESIELGRRFASGNKTTLQELREQGGVKDAGSHEKTG